MKQMRYITIDVSDWPAKYDIDTHTHDTSLFVTTRCREGTRDRSWPNRREGRRKTRKSMTARDASASENKNKHGSRPDIPGIEIRNL